MWFKTFIPFHEIHDIIKDKEVIGYPYELTLNLCRQAWFMHV